MTALGVVCFFTASIHFFETAALSLRLAGARTGQVATSIAFVNTSFLIARLSNMFQAPLLGAMVDTAILEKMAHQLVDDFRWIVLAAFLGNLLGALAFPSLANISQKAILSFEIKPSIPRLLIKAFYPGNWLKILKYCRIPSGISLKGIQLRTIPKTFLFFNVLMVSIYTIGVLASLLAAAYLPDLRATASQLSGIVNGMATILLALLVDPTGAHITDQAVRGKRELSDVKSMVFFLVCGRLLGTLIVAQFILWPAAQYIMVVTRWVAGLF